MFGADTFLLARIARREPAGLLAELDLGRMSPALQPLAERLIVAGHRERQMIWDEFLAREVAYARTVHVETAPEPAEDADGTPVDQPAGPRLPPDPPLSSPVYPLVSRPNQTLGSS
jgi:hypothetical protein